MQRTDAFRKLEDYEDLSMKFLASLSKYKPTRIVSPNAHNYVFFQYGSNYGHRITRPLNTDLLLELPDMFEKKVRQFHDVLEILRRATGNRTEAIRRKGFDLSLIDSVIYTIQQTIGSIGDSLPNPNQSRKRVGQLFEGLIRLIIEAVGVNCEGRTIRIPIPGYSGRSMTYELDMVLSRGNAIVASETRFIAPEEIVGSIKTTSKDRLDKIFLDKFLMSKLLERNVKVVAIFLHDVQRARRGTNLFGINSTFKTNHFLGYSIALNPLDGVYYVDPRPAMVENPDLAKRIGGFSRFLTQDIWKI